jgi:PKD repeat protein
MVINQNDTIKPFGGEYSSAFPFIVSIDTSFTQFDFGIATKVKGDFTKIEAITIDNAGNIFAGGKTTDSIYNSFGTGISSQGGPSDFFIAKISDNNNCGCTKATPYPQMVSIINKTITVKGTATGITDSLYWHWGDGTTTKYLVQNTNTSHTYTAGGNYTVILRTHNYCGTKDATLQITALNVEEQELKYLNAYPNPVNNILTIENPYPCSMQLNLYSITGKLLYSNKYENYTSKLDMSNYERGIYFVEIQLTDGRRGMRKVVKN